MHVIISRKTQDQQLQCGLLFNTDDKPTISIPPGYEICLVSSFKGGVVIEQLSPEGEAQNPIQFLFPEAEQTKARSLKQMKNNMQFLCDTYANDIEKEHINNLLARI